jgi:hypothetical protein
MTSAGDDWMREIKRRQGYDAMARDEGYGPMKNDLKDVKADLRRIADEEGDVLCRAALKEIEALEAENARLRQEGQAVVDRWDTPLWKDAEATGRIINRLRAALKGDRHD